VLVVFVGMAVNVCESIDMSDALIDCLSLTETNIEVSRIY
jgi:hypothetical protein